MKNPTPMFPGFHLKTLRRKPRSAQQLMAEKIDQLKQKSISQLGQCFGKYISIQQLRPMPTGISSRQRIFSQENTFWTFFSQELDSDGGCKEVLKKLQAFAAMRSKTLPSSSTAGYCKARKRLDISSLKTILKETAEGRGFLADNTQMKATK